MDKVKLFIVHILIFAFLVFTVMAQDENSITSHASDASHGGGSHRHEFPSGDLESDDVQTWLKNMTISFLENAYPNTAAYVKDISSKSIFNNNVSYYNVPTKVYDKNSGSYIGNPSSSSTSTPNSYYYYQGGTTTTNNSTTNNYRVYQDFSNKTTNTYNYQWYNPITNTYNTTNNYQYSYDYNTYYYQQTINNYQYDYYYIDNSTHVTYYIIQSDTSGSEADKEYIYDTYYQLPDGRNSYTLTADDVWGQYFLYNTSKYNIVPEDDGTTLGLWHFDGNLEDSSYWHNSTGLSSKLQYSDGVFNEGKYVTDLITLPLDKSSFDPSEPFTLEWREFFSGFKSNYSSDGINYYVLKIIPLYDKNYVTGGWQINEFAHYALVYDGSDYSFYLNGVKKNLSTADYYNDVICPAGFHISDEKIIINNDYYVLQDFKTAKYIVPCHPNSTIDEMRLSKGILYDSDFAPPVQPFDTNEVLVIPDDVDNNTVLFYTRYDYNDYRIGGVRPTYPTDGYIYVAVENDVVQSVQQYQVNHWEEIEAFLYNDGQVTSLKNYNLSGNKVTEPVDPDQGSSGTGSGNNTGDNQGGSSDDDGFDFWGAVGDLLGGVIDFFGTILGLLGKLVGLFSDIVSGLFSFLEVFTGFGGGFTDFLVAVFPFIPSEVWKLIGAGISAMILVGIIKLIRG